MFGSYPSNWFQFNVEIFCNVVTVDLSTPSYFTSYEFNPSVQYGDQIILDINPVCSSDYTTTYSTSTLPTWLEWDVSAMQFYVPAE